MINIYYNIADKNSFINLIGFTKKKNLSDYNASKTLENKETYKEQKHVSTQNIKHWLVPATFEWFPG